MAGFIDLIAVEFLCLCRLIEPFTFAALAHVVIEHPQVRGGTAIGPATTASVRLAWVRRWHLTALPSDGPASNVRVPLVWASVLRNNHHVSSADVMQTEYEIFFWLNIVRFHHIGLEMTDDASSEKIKVLIIDDDLTLCALIRREIDRDPDLTCVDTVSTQDDAVKAVRLNRPDVILVDIKLGPEVKWFVIVKHMLTQSRESQVLIWTSWTDGDVDRREEVRLRRLAINSGAIDWIPKTEKVDQLVTRIKEVARNDQVPNRIMQWLSKHVAEYPSLADYSGPGGTLTETEQQIVKVVAMGLEAGMSIKQLANVRSVSPKTLQTQLMSIYRKWGVHSHLELVAEARNRGLC